MNQNVIQSKNVKFILWFEEENPKYDCNHSFKRDRNFKNNDSYHPKDPLSILALKVVEILIPGSQNNHQKGNISEPCSPCCHEFQGSNIMLTYSYYVDISQYEGKGESNDLNAGVVEFRVSEPTINCEV